MDAQVHKFDPDKVEAGLEFLLQDGWLPGRCDSADALSRLDATDIEWAIGADGSVALNGRYVERLGVCYALLRRAESTAGINTPALLESLERMGVEVTTDFASSGHKALRLLDTAAALVRGDGVDALRVDSAMHDLGDLWEAAFRAPRGFAHYIARSARGLVPSELNFFMGAEARALNGVELGRWMEDLVDLLQAAIASSSRPVSTIGVKPGAGDWTNLRGTVSVPVGRNRSEVLEVHSKREGLVKGAVRQHVKLVSSVNRDVVAMSRGVLLSSQSGMLEDFVDLGIAVGGQTERYVRGVLQADDVVSIWPSVRLLLDQAENQVRELFVIEGTMVAPRWRQREIGELIHRQSTMEVPECDLAIGRPGAFVIPGGPTTLGARAAYCASRLKIARHFERVGGEFLINGMMGLGARKLNEARARARAEREPS